MPCLTHQSALLCTLMSWAKRLLFSNPITIIIINIEFASGSSHLDSVEGYPLSDQFEYIVLDGLDGQVSLIEPM